jgi:hypothetical protein
MSDIVSSKPIIDALAARGFGQRPSDPKASEFDASRLLTSLGGCLYEPQILCLKRNTMLITDSNKIGLGIDTDAKTLSYTYGPPIEYKRTPKQIQEMMEQMTAQVLGLGWTVTSGQKSSVVESTHGSRKKPSKPNQAKKSRRKTLRPNR